MDWKYPQPSPYLVHYFDDDCLPVQLSHLREGWQIWNGHPRTRYQFEMTFPGWRHLLGGPPRTRYHCEMILQGKCPKCHHCCHVSNQYLLHLHYYAVMFSNSWNNLCYHFHHNFILCPPLPPLPKSLAHPASCASPLRATLSCIIKWVSYFDSKVSHD